MNDVLCSGGAGYVRLPVFEPVSGVSWATVLLVWWGIWVSTSSR
jgi:hypothetical protein